LALEAASPDNFNENTQSRYGGAVAISMVFGAFFVFVFLSTIYDMCIKKSRKYYVPETGEKFELDVNLYKREAQQS
jgi:hypothetical protein